MTDANLDDLDPRLQPIAEQFLVLCNAQFATKIIVTWRSAEDQDIAHANGLSNAGAGESPHNCTDAAGRPAARAFDFAVFNADGSYVTDGTDERYGQAGEIAKNLLLAWGGDWLQPDFDHVELTGWKSLTAPAAQQGTAVT